MDAAILPVKRLDEAKSRLSPDLTAEQRRRVAEALFEDALALCRSTNFLQWWVVSDDPYVLGRADDESFGTVPDPGGGLNPALAAAIATATQAGATSVTIVPADTPLVWKGDLQDLLDTGATSDVVAVPSGADGGTNALYLAPPTLIEPQFGPGSLQAHIKLAELKGHRCSVLAMPRFALDLDTAEDARALIAKPPQDHDGATLRLLRELLPEAS
jgi:2-phospho-L-lactate guanylyltransferase